MVKLEITDNLLIKAELDNGMNINSTLGQLTSYEILCYANFSLPIWMRYGPCGRAIRPVRIDS